MRLIDHIFRIAYRAEDRVFEWRYGFSFGGVIPGSLLDIEDTGAKASATAYQGVYCRNLRNLLDTAHREYGAFRCFVDIGSGKGKPCLYASLRQAYVVVRGVEFSPSLVNQANANLKRVQPVLASRGIDLEFLRADARKYELPEMRCLVFMFNPFDAPSIKQFVEQNLAHFSKWDSMIAYANDQHYSTIVELGFDVRFRDPVRKISLLGYVRC